MSQAKHNDKNLCYCECHAVHIGSAELCKRCNHIDKQGHRPTGNPAHGWRSHDPEVIASHEYFEKHHREKMLQEFRDHLAAKQKQRERDALDHS